MNAVLRGDVNSIRVGACSNVQDCAVLHGQRNLYPVMVGDWVTIGHNATVHGCTVEDKVVIGMGATVLNDARIGEGCIIAAGSVVPEHTVVPPRTLWAGVPAKMRRELTDKDRALIREYAQNYLDYVEIYLAEGSQRADRGPGCKLIPSLRQCTDSPKPQNEMLFILGRRQHPVAS